MMPDLNGKWMGELIYDESFGRLANEAMLFMVDIKKNDDEFKGISVDVDGIGMYPAEAKVNGFVADGQINFVKEYQQSTGSEKTNADLSRNSRSEISFSGAFNANNNEFEGTWISLSEFRSFNNNAPGPFKGGTWRMKREA